MDFYENCLHSFEKITENPEEFLESNEEHRDNIKKQLKYLYDYSKNKEKKYIKSDALPELIIQDFDLEQIWQEIELQNESLLTRSLMNISKVLIKKDKLNFNNEDNDSTSKTVNGSINLNEDLENNQFIASKNNEENSESDEENSDKLEENFSDNSTLESNDDEKTSDIKTIKQKTLKTSIVDDEFFNLNEMENFLLNEESKLNKNDKDYDYDDDDDFDDNDDHEDSKINLFEDNSESDDESGKYAKYKDFFEPHPQNVKKRIDEEYDDETENQNNAEIKSTFEQRQERLQKKIDIIEESAISEKPWQLKGEITADGRPYNSLLEEIVDFDLVSRPTPVITENTTLQLDDIIRQRIKDKAFDDVEKKVKPIPSILEYKKQLTLNQEKSKQSLAQIYEQEYLAEKEKLNPDNEEKEEEEPELHREINKMMNELFTNLDTLSHYHFTPKPAIPELKIISNLPALSMEEVAPVAISDANLLAPEEIQMKPSKGDIIGKSERTKTDKNRDRRKKKQKQKIHARIQMKKQKNNINTKEKNKKLLDKITKNKNINKMNETLNSKSVKSSKAFFSQLEDEIKTQIKNKIQIKKSNLKVLDAKKLKL